MVFSTSASLHIPAGSSIGAVVYSITLNNLINGRVGFAWGVR